MLETKEAPEAVAPAIEGKTKKLGKRSVGSKRTRLARAATATRGTVAADRRIIIEDKPNVKASIHTGAEIRSAAPARSLRDLVDELPGMPVVVRRTGDGKRVRVWRTADGRWWRCGGIVRIQKWGPAGGERHFVVTLFTGANESDVEFLLSLVEDARRGEGFGPIWGPVDASWADELTFSTASSSRRYADPYTTIDRSPDVIVCDEPLCRKAWHPDWADHVLDEAAQSTVGKRFEVIVRRPVGGDDPWTVEVHADDFFGSPADVSTFVNDLNWMQAECERANACRATGVGA